MTDSDNLELKKRSRRRLVGAAALALFAAIVLPMVMDQEPAAPVQDIQITIPDREANAALARPIAGQEQAAEPQLAPPPEEQAPAGAAEAVRPSVAAEPSSATAPVPPRAPVPSEVLAESKTKPMETKAPAPTPVAGEAERAQAILEGRKAPVATAAEAFVVQIGAFSESSKASAIAVELKKRGMQAYTEKAGTMTRVRIGPFATRDDAEAVAQRTKAGGFGGSVMSR